MTQIQNINSKRKSVSLFRIFTIATLTGLVLFGKVLGQEQQVTFKMELPPADVPQPQLFCGYCHVLTYPGVVQKGYDLWKNAKHNKFGCVECHYPPREVQQKNVGASATEVKPGHIPQKPPERFSYLQLGGETIKTRPRIIDASCMTAACHGKPDDQFKTKKIKFAEKVLFVHEPHLDKKKQIEGQQLNCTSCHQHETDIKKFEVTKASCHLCHFSNVKFNQDRGRCEVCHELPQKPIQTSGEKPITHQMLKDAKVDCSSCHLDVIQAAGAAKYEAYFEKGVLKTALFLGSGKIKKENCLACHDQTKALKEVTNKKLMHQKHVTIKNARCFDCHQPVMHAKADLKNPPDQKNLSRLDLQRTIDNSCSACHPDPHRYQRILAQGAKQKDISSAPDPMYKARTNCLGCHVEEKTTQKGLRLMQASAATCVQCHTKDHKKMLKDWKSELAKELEYTIEVQKETLAALKKSKSRISKANLAKARKMMAEGQQYLNIVKFGNGVHNKKYSIMLFDAAITRFEDTMDFLEESQ